MSKFGATVTKVNTIGEQLKTTAFYLDIVWSRASSQVIGDQGMLLSQISSVRTRFEEIDAERKQLETDKSKAKGEDKKSLEKKLKELDNEEVFLEGKTDWLYDKCDALIAEKQRAAFLKPEPPEIATAATANLFDHKDMDRLTGPLGDESKYSNAYWDWIQNEPKVFDDTQAAIDAFKAEVAEATGTPIAGPDEKELMKKMNSYRLDLAVYHNPDNERLHQRLYALSTQIKFKAPGTQVEYNAAGMVQKPSA